LHCKIPESSGRLDEPLLFSPGFLESTINRMELAACRHAFEWVAEQGNSLDVQRVQIFADSLYVFENHKHATTLRKQKWCNRDGRPVENPDLWKSFIRISANVLERVDIFGVKGKKSPILKAVDKAAKAAGRAPTKVDREFAVGRLASQSSR